MFDVEAFRVAHPVSTTVLAVGIWVIRGGVLLAMRPHTTEARIRSCCRWVGPAFVMWRLF